MTLNSDHQQRNVNKFHRTGGQHRAVKKVNLVKRFLLLVIFKQKNNKKNVSHLLVELVGFPVLCGTSEVLKFVMAEQLPAEQPPTNVEQPPPMIEKPEPMIATSNQVNE